MNRLLSLLLDQIKNSLGPLASNPTIVNTAVLGTTPLKALAAATVPVGQVRRCKIIIVSEEGQIGWQTVAKGATAPTIAADADGSADEGILILQEQKFEYVNVPDDRDLYWVASGASTLAQLSYTE